MAKTLVRFDGELIDAMLILTISKTEKYNENLERMDFNIVINSNVSESIFIRNKTFSYGSAEFRDKRLEELVTKLEHIEHVKIL